MLNGLILYHRVDVFDAGLEIVGCVISCDRCLTAWQPDRLGVKYPPDTRRALTRHILFTYAGASLNQRLIDISPSSAI